uniref:Uncharacterized protein n=1 Tax=Oryza brachyantha TaxID=4533 RepID=J3N087_ORYBR
MVRRFRELAIMPMFSLSPRGSSGLRELKLEAFALKVPSQGIMTLLAMDEASPRSLSVKDAEKRHAASDG